MGAGLGGGATRSHRWRRGRPRARDHSPRSSASAKTWSASGRRKTSSSLPPRASRLIGAGQMPRRLSSDRLAAIDARLGEIDTRLAKDFPDYAALASPKPLSVTDVQAELRDDEALVLFLDTDDRFKPTPEETFIWVVTKTDSRWVRSDLGTESLKRAVAALRCGLDYDGSWGLRTSPLRRTAQDHLFGGGSQKRQATALRSCQGAQRSMRRCSARSKT